MATTTDLDTLQEYTRSRNHSTQKNCRMSLRRGGAELAVIIPAEIAAQAGLAIGGCARLLFDSTKIVITPAADGAFRMRALRSGAHTHPHLLVPIGPGKPFDCTFAKAGSIACQHELSDGGGLMLVLPDEIRLTANS